MRSSVTLPQLKAIFLNCGAKSSDADLIECMNQCNEQADIIYQDIWGNDVKPRTACGWAEFFALQTAQEQQ